MYLLCFLIQYCVKICFNYLNEYFLDFSKDLIHLKSQINHLRHLIYVKHFALSKNHFIILIIIFLLTFYLLLSFSGAFYIFFKAHFFKFTYFN